ncbi:lipoate--protein ligase family protein [Alicyclobacillus mengziensis]|nr:ligase [Alicyclobacillus mengziensis]
MTDALWPEDTEVQWIDDIEDSARNLELEVILGQAVAKGEIRPLIRIWRSALSPGIGVSRRDVASLQGEQAMEQLKQDGWDVVVRTTGGTAVPQGQGVVHLSYLFPRNHRKATTDAYYRLLCLPLIDWLGTLGLKASTGALLGSYCDGTYNILVDGKKLVGTAQAWRGGLAGVSSSRPGYILAHACLVVDVDMVAAAERINRFYAASGNDYRVDAATTTTLRTLAPNRFTGMTPLEAANSVAREWVTWYGALLAAQASSRS